MTTLNHSPSMIKTTAAACAIAAIGLASWSSHLAAQELPAQPPPQPEVEIEDRQLEQAADAYMAVSEIQQRLQQELAGVEDREVIEQKVEEARPEMLDAISKAGLATADYERIINAVNQDEDLRMAFIQLLEARRPAEERAAPQTALDPADVTSAQVEQASQVYLAVSAINQRLQLQLEGVEDQAVIQEQVAEAEQAMLRVVEEAGLEVEEYGEIMQAIQQDEELMQEFMEHVQQQ